MMSRTVCAAALAALLVCHPLRAGGQGAAKSADGPSIAELKEQIARLLAVENSDSVPAEVKTLNRTFLEERRAKLRTLLSKRVTALRSYLESVGTALSPSEVKIVEQSISELEADLGGQTEGAGRPAPRAEVTSVRSSDVPPLAEPVLSGVSLPAAPPASPVQRTSPRGDEGGGRGLVPTDAQEAAQDDELDKTFKKELKQMASEVARATPQAGQTREQARKEAFDFTANPILFSILLTGRTFSREEFVRDVEEARIDKQAGGTQGNAGSTTLVSKGGTAEVIAFAVENGGLEREVDGTSVTLRGNPVGLVEAFQKKGFIPSYEDDSESARLLRKLSFSATFDTSRGDTPGTFLANRQQLSSYSLRYEFKNDRDPRHEKYRAEWRGLVQNHAQKVVNAFTRIVGTLDDSPAYSEWRVRAQNAVAAASDAELPEVMRQQFEAFMAIDIPPDLASFVRTFESDFTEYRRERSRLLEIVANAPIFTFEYVNDRRPGLIDTSMLNFIAETGLFRGKADLTYNGSFTFFNASPGAGMKRLRNFDNSLRLDLPVGDPRRFSGVLTFAGQYKRLTEDEMTEGGALMPIKGDMATGQLLFTIPIRGSGVKIPFSFTFANRTEFVKEKEVRGNFGFTFDLDSILQRFKPFSSDR